MVNEALPVPPEQHIFSLTVSLQNVHIYTFSVQPSILLNFPPPPYLSNGSSKSPIRALAMFIILEIGIASKSRNLSNFAHICRDYPRCIYQRLCPSQSAKNGLSTDTLNQHLKTSTLLSLAFILRYTSSIWLGSPSEQICAIAPAWTLWPRWNY